MTGSSELGRVWEEAVVIYFKLLPEHHTGSRDSSVSIVTRVRAGRPGFDSLHHRVQIGSGVYTASYPMGTGTRESDHTPPCSACVYNA